VKQLLGYRREQTIYVRIRSLCLVVERQSNGKCPRVAVDTEMISSITGHDVVGDATGLTEIGVDGVYSEDSSSDSNVLLDRHVVAGGVEEW